MSSKQDSIGVYGVRERECIGHYPDDEPLTLTRCHSCEITQLYKALKGRKSVSGRNPQLRGIKGKISFFISFSFTNLILQLISWHDACQPCSGRNYLKYNNNLLK